VAGEIERYVGRHSFPPLGAVWSDPVKKVPTAEADKLAKACVEAFAKAMLAGDGDAAIQCCDVPFLEPDGRKKEKTEDLKREFDRPPPPGAMLVVGDVIALDKVNDAFKKAGHDELADDVLKRYADHAGADARVVTISVSQGGQNLARPGKQAHVLVRVKDGKAKIVGVGGR
jgi:hypothetical protein